MLGTGGPGNTGRASVVLIYRGAGGLLGRGAQNYEGGGFPEADSS
jgi:hypothetical protein